MEKTTSASMTDKSQNDCTSGRCVYYWDITVPFINSYENHIQNNFVKYALCLITE